MKITSFNPLIATTDAEPLISLFEELGFESRHTKEGISINNAKNIRMKDANGFYLDISQPGVEFPRDLVAIRINVDDFDEARKVFEEHGFKSNTGQIVEDSSSKSIGMYAPSGFQISLVEHIKK